ncbi:MAG: DUF4142 domain-containing protein [Myxococcota bacterium]|nr:DUF4142 domain-containing protein [Myxococcota bacterium]
MKIQRFDVVATGLLVGAVTVLSATGVADDKAPRPQSPDARAQSPDARPPSAGRTMNRDQVSKVLAGWPAGPQLAGQETMSKYGPPHEVTSERMIWNDVGPYQRIMLTRKQLPHDFPLPHMDYLQHTINYKVPADKADDVHAFDASITIYRVGGELSARCDLESNNVLTLNLANDIVTGKRTVADARKQFGQLVMQRTLGKNPAYTTTLQFKPHTATAAAEIEAPTLPGAPKRAEASAAGTADHAGAGAAGTAGGKADMQGGDAEILAMLITHDQDEVRAAMIAREKKVSQPVMAFADMLHQHHGKNVLDTTQLGQKLGVRPVKTKAVEQLHEKDASGLAKVVALDGQAFERAFLDHMVKGHTDAIQLVDQQIQAAQNEALKTHLTRTRQQLVKHLDEARRLQGEQGSNRTSRR